MWPFARRPEPPSLASGLTLTQWDELYGEPAMRRLFGKFRKVAIYSGLFAVGLWGLVLALAEPGHRAGRLLSSSLFLVIFFFGVCSLRRYGPMEMAG